MKEKVPERESSRKKMFNNLKKIIKEYAPPTIAITFVYILFAITGVGCPIKFVTGISCPGCGMVRAWLSILRLDFSSAFYYHPLFWIVPIGCILLLVKNKISKKIFYFFISVIVILFFVVYLIRMFNSDGQIVSFHPSESIFIKVLKFMRRVI